MRVGMLACFLSNVVISSIVPLACRRAPPVLLSATAAPQADWGGLPGAVKSSKASALNTQIVNAKTTDTILTLVSDNHERLNGVNVATAMHNVAKLTKFKRAERDALLRDPRYQQLLDSTIDKVDELGERGNARAVADILWSCATLSNFPPLLLKPVLTQVQPAANPAPAPLSNARAPLATAGGQVP